MRIRSALSLLAVAGALLLGVAGTALAQGALPNGVPPGGGPGGPPPPNDKTYEVQIQLEASSNLYQKYGTQGVTWHHGLGFIAPFGYASYNCGKGFPEEKNFPLTPWQAGLFNTLTGRADALFCLYTTKDGTFFVRDSVAGTVYRDTDDQGNGASRNMMVNLVVGGSGAYVGATGIWTGFTEGRGTVSSPAAGRMLPAVLLKIMNGYVKIPAAPGK